MPLATITFEPVSNINKFEPTDKVLRLTLVFAIETFPDVMIFEALIEFEPAKEPYKVVPDIVDAFTVFEPANAPYMV